MTKKELIKIEERIGYRIRIAEKEDKEFYEGFNINKLVEVICTDLEEENMKPTIQNIDCAFDGLWE